MKSVTIALFAAAVWFSAGPGWAQNEHAGHEGMTGGFIANDGSIHDHWGGEHRIPEVGNHGEGSGSRPGSGGGSSGGAPGTSAATVPVTLNGETFNVRPETRQELSDFIDQYETNGAVGQVVAAAASLFYTIGLVSEPATLVTFSVDDAVVNLSAPSIFSTAWRGLALGIIRSHITSHALTPHHQQEMRMWQRLEDIIRNPQRYENGVRLDDSGKLMLRELPGERYRDRAVAGAVSDFDKQHLSLLFGALRDKPRAMDYLATADFVTGRYLEDQGASALSIRDYLLINKALLTLHSSHKYQLDWAFYATANDPRANTLLWLRLRAYLYSELWTDIPMAGLYQIMSQDDDAMGFWDDDPDYDDGFWDQVEAANAPWYRINYYPGPYYTGQTYQYHFFWQY